MSAERIPNEERIIGYYQEKLSESGFTAKGVDWKDEESQELRFEVINRYIDLDVSPSVLDVGCGAGSYYAYCKSLGKEIAYTGLDIVPEMTEHVKATHPEVQVYLGPIDDFTEAHDYVIASGTFNASIGTDMEAWASYVKSSILKMHQLARKAVIINLMSPYVDYTYERLYYPDLNELTRFLIDNCGRDWVIDHDYELYEFTLMIRKSKG
ncbi:MAG: class I SAM-dependent methyltransferase [Flavobacteriales bacterium]|nr:class I SAM-dependent methyltransferase [Flavobacteriales bacterium]